MLRRISAIKFVKADYGDRVLIKSGVLIDEGSKIVKHLINLLTHGINHNPVGFSIRMLRAYEFLPPKVLYLSGRCAPLVGTAAFT